jgi:hypothetical protein
LDFFSWYVSRKAKNYIKQHHLLRFTQIWVVYIMDLEKALDDTEHSWEYGDVHEQPNKGILRANSGRDRSERFEGLSLLAW